MKKPIKIIICAFFIIIGLGLIYRFTIVHIQDYFISKKVVYWSKDVKIDILDYQSKVDEDSNSDIYYYHGIYLKATSIETAFTRSFFDKSKSWIRDTSQFNFKQCNELQQMIFDLNEVYSRKYNVEIDKIKNLKSTKISDYKRIGDSLDHSLKIEIKEIFDSDLNTAQKIRKFRPMIDELLSASKE